MSRIRQAFWSHIAELLIEWEYQRAANRRLRIRRRVQRRRGWMFE